MATPPICDFGWKAPEFSLKNIDGRMISLNEANGENGLLVMFICNHCPYVKAIIPKLIRDANGLLAMGVGVVAINANDAVSHPDDSYEMMQKTAAEHRFTFPYLHDETQEIARSYNAVCTPDFFGFNGDLGLQYRGRLDASRAAPAPDDLRRDLYLAMKTIAATGMGPTDQIPSMGCSIKWKPA